VIGARVLVVEDERLIAEEMCDRLARLGLVPVGIAATGDDALRQIETERPDLVLLDIRLKHGPDGISTAESSSPRSPMMRRWSARSICGQRAIC
jgi:two-component system cell cycle sensor histidine kinase/response regulator CckA